MPSFLVSCTAIVNFTGNRVRRAEPFAKTRDNDLMKKLLLALTALVSLAACGAEPIWAPDDAVATARYEHPGPTSITLYTVLSTRSGAGAHAGLLINGSQRVLFDPAGTWRHPRLPEGSVAQIP
jgi:predicted small lipoprotein YifL